MATSFDEATRVCLAPPGEDPDTAAGAVSANAFRPNVMAAQIPFRENGPAINVGVANFSLEAWLLHNTTVAPDIGTVIGLVQTDVAGDPANSLRAGLLAGGGFIAQYDDPVAAGMVQVNVAYPAEGTWFHAAINFNRAGNMELFANGQSQGTVAINANAMGAHEFQVAGIDPLKANYDDTGSGNVITVLVGPVAMHATLLTAAQITQSVWNHTVNDLGSATTLVRYDWLVENHTGWDFTRANLLVSHDRVTLGHPTGAPTGPNGTPRVRDRSGNNRHWAIQTAATYTSTNATKAEIVFCADPFFI